MSAELAEDFEKFEEENVLAMMHGLWQSDNVAGEVYERHEAWNDDPETSEEENLLNPELLHEARGYEGSYESRDRGDTPNW